jgi:hypothetical protein
MRWHKIFARRWRIPVLFFSFIFLGPNVFTVFAAESFRTPAHIFGKRFAVKVLMKQGTGHYIATFWLDPSAKVSTVDEKQMQDMGWMGVSRLWDEISVSGHLLNVFKFKNESNEQAYLPDYYKSCCVGRLGQDVLNSFDLKMVEEQTAYVEWTVRDAARSASAVRHETVWIVPKWKLPKKALFSYRFVPPDRRVELTGVFTGPDGEKIPVGSEWTRINGKIAERLDRPLLDRYLTGQIAPVLDLEFDTFKNTNNKKTLEPTPKKLIQVKVDFNS